MKKITFLLFYKLNHFFRWVSEDGWSDWKALLVIQVLFAFLILSVDIYIKVLFKGSSLIMDLPKAYFIILFVAYSLLNYYYFLHEDRWKMYQNEFENYPKNKSRLISLLVLSFIILVLFSLIGAFYQMSLVDWSKYR